MKKLTLALFLFFPLQIFAQDFFREDFDTGKKYILLAHPTVGNTGNSSL